MSQLRNEDTSISGGSDFALSNATTDTGVAGSLAKSISAQIKSPHGRPSIIASNLASARGIPSSQRGRSQPISPTLSAQQAGGKLSRLEDGRLLPEAQLRGSTSGQKSVGLYKPRRTKSSSTSMVNNDESRALKRENSSVCNAKQGPSVHSSEESFQRFFSTFDTLFSKLSAPLAFAGLPLKVSEDRADSKTTMKEKEKTFKNLATEPDVNQYFSKSTLRALRDEHGSKSPFGPGESFYVVPTTGGTHSYAGILARSKEDYEQKPPRPLDNVVEESEDGSGSFDHFVDASEVPPSSPRTDRSRPGVRKHNSFSLSGTSRKITGGKTMEELHLENTALRQLLDTQSRRLQMWEASAQSQSQALAQSFRALHECPPVHAPPIAPTASEATAAVDQDSDVAAGTATAAVTAAEERVRKLEGEVKNTQQEMDACAAENAKFAKENEKLKVVIGRYREKWEQLKAGAKLRRENIVSNAGEGKNDGLVEGLEGD